MTFPVDIYYCEDLFFVFKALCFTSKVGCVNKELYFYNTDNANSAVHNITEKLSKSEYRVYLDIYKLLDDMDLLHDLEREISWRFLKYKQDLVLDANKIDLFNSILPQSKKYIVSCPLYFCNGKIKIMMWTASHHMQWVTRIIIKYRTIKHSR